jgi:hypothetical protein
MEIIDYLLRAAMADRMAAQCRSVDVREGYLDCARHWRGLASVIASAERYRFLFGERPPLKLTSH